MTAFTEILHDSLGMAIGIVTTVPFCHATPAAFAAHNPDRENYTSDAAGPGETGIAEEMVLEFRPEVLIGAGHPAWDNPHWSPGDGYISREMLRDLRRGLEGVLFLERIPGVDASWVLSLAGLAADADAGPSLFALYGGAEGCFEPGELVEGGSVGRASRENPSLARAATTALGILSGDEQGLFLMIEQGDIDWAAHRNDIGWLIASVHDLEQAVAAVCGRLDCGPVSLENTVVLVTADHECGGLEIIDDGFLASGSVPGMDGTPDSSWCPGGEVVFHSSDHTNAPVGLYACGPAAALAVLDSLEGCRPSPGTGYLDNTQIHDFFRIVLIERRLARNGILFIGDGMGTEAENAASLFLHGRRGAMLWQDPSVFPFASLCTTWDIDTYDARASALVLPPYSPESFDPLVGSDMLHQGSW